MSDLLALPAPTLTGTEIAAMDAEIAAALAELPPPEPPPRERDPDRATPAEARRLVNRLRRARFFLWMDVTVYEDPHKDSWSGWRSHQHLQVTARQLMDLLKDLERIHSGHYVRVHHIPAEPGQRYSSNYVSVG